MSDLAGLERAAFARLPDRVDRLVQVLEAIVAGQLIVDAGAPTPRPSFRTTIARAAAAAAAVLADPAAEIPAAALERMFILKATLDQLFEASDFKSADYAIRALDELPPAGAPLDAAGVNALARRLLLQSIDSALEPPLDRLGELPPGLAQLAAISHIATKPVITLAGQERRERLLERAATLEPALTLDSADHLVRLSSAWMLCSYAAGPAKHGVKAVLNRTLRAWAESLGLRDAPTPAPRVLKPRPTLVIAAEVMHSNHVQYRYFGQYLRQLRQRFHLVLVTEKHEADASVQRLFDKVLTFERRIDNSHLAAAAALIRSVEPDMVFWLSVGMRHWGPLVANVRLAPIQFTGLGHSASTFCDTIDYYVLEEGYVSDPALLSETVILLPDESLRFERSPHYKPIAPSVRETASPLRVALPSNVLKLNPGFLSVVARIRAAAKRPLELHVLAATNGLEAEAFQAGLQAILPGAHLHRSLPYSRYLSILSNCDINLSPFPFGGLHSVVDSLRQGLPVVAMEGPELHGRTDSMLLRRLGLPEWLIAHDEDEYVAAALRVIDDDDTRVALSRQALALDIDTLLFGDADTPLRSEVGDAVWWIYQNHERIQASGRHAWSVRDRAEF